VETSLQATDLTDFKELEVVTYTDGEVVWCFTIDDALRMNGINEYNKKPFPDSFMDEVYRRQDYIAELTNWVSGEQQETIVLTIDQQLSHKLQDIGSQWLRFPTIDTIVGVSIDEINEIASIMREYDLQIELTEPDPKPRLLQLLNAIPPDAYVTFAIELTIYMESNILICDITGVTQWVTIDFRETFHIPDTAEVEPFEDKLRVVSTTNHPVLLPGPEVVITDGEIFVRRPLYTLDEWIQYLRDNGYLSPLYDGRFTAMTNTHESDNRLHTRHTYTIQLDGEPIRLNRVVAGGPTRRRRR
jgi:hypothetical protein